MNTMTCAKKSLLGGAAAFAIIAYGDFACAQASTASPPATPGAEQVSDTEVEAIVVTGTLLRGVAPTGTNVVTMNADQIVRSGATSSNQVLARVPQVASAFNKVPSLSATDGGNSVIRPNLRNLGAAGGNTTLILVDGHRQVNAGILITSPDPDVIPPSVLERVDIVPDGGSSIYGSDAIGGVINFITKKSFDGVQVDARYGAANSYKSFDTSLTVGKAWDTGSSYIAATYAKNDAIFGKDRDYVRQIAPNNGYCAPGTVFISNGGTTNSYALPGRTAGTQTSCDYTDNLSIIPAQQRVSLYGAFNQELSGAVELDVRGFYTRRTTSNYRDFNQPGDYGQSVTITSANPFYSPIGATDPGVQTVHLSYAGLTSNKIENSLDEFGLTPTLKADLGSGWQARVLGNFQRSTVVTRTPQIDAVAQERALAGTTTTTALNPYNLSATSRSVLDSILGQEYARAQQDLVNARAIVDGSLFELPGGSVHVAVGAEFTRETLKNQIIGTFRGGADVSRKVESAFGEVAVPIVGSANAMPGVQSLTLSASGRYDHYSDFGGTFNPKVGVTYKPISDVTIRANWGKSFNAPSLADKDGAPDTRAILISASSWVDPTDPASNANRPTILLAGGNANLKPQKAKTWSAGFDITPSIAPGLRLSTTLYNIDMSNQIGIIPIFTGNTYVPTYAAYYLKNPTLAQATAIIGNLPIVGASSIASLYGGVNGDPYVLLDARRQNLGLLKQRGVDFNATYTAPTDFGSITFSTGGTYTLRRKISGGVGVPFTNDLKTPGASRFSLLSSIGANVGQFNGTVTWTHSAGYKLNPAVATQTKVDAFDTVDVFMGYDFKGEGLSKDLSVSVNVANLFNQDPPFYNQDPGFTNGSTLGRLVQVGVSKRF